MGSDLKAVVLLDSSFHMVRYNADVSDNTEGDRLVSCALVKNAFKVETLKTFASGATPESSLISTRGTPRKPFRGCVAILSLKYANLLIKARHLCSGYKPLSLHH